MEVGTEVGATEPKARRRFLPLLVSGIAISATLGVSAAPAMAAGTKAKHAKLAAPPVVNVEATLNLVSAPLLLSLGQHYLGVVASKFHTKFVYNPGTSPNVQIANLLGGSDQFYSPVSAAVIPAVAAGKDIKLINQLSVGGTQMLIGAIKYRSSRGKNVAAYSGGTWCYAAPGSASENAVQAGATSAGLNWSSQRGISLGSSAAFLPTMQSGECDITGEDATDAANAINQGIGYLVQNQTIKSVGLKVFGGRAPQLGAVLATTSQFANKYPALTVAIDQALIKAEMYLAYYSKNPLRIYSRMPAIYKNSNSVGSFVEQWSLVAPSFTVGSGIFVPASIQATVDYLQKMNQIGSVSSPIAPAFLNTYTRKAYANLGLPKPPASGKILSNALLQKHRASLGL